MNQGAFPTVWLLALSACGQAGTEPGPGGVSVEDAQALDDAAEKLDTPDQGQANEAPAK